MTTPPLYSATIFRQRLLCAAGVLSASGLDGIRGPQTLASEKRLADAREKLVGWWNNPGEIEKLRSLLPPMSLLAVSARETINGTWEKGGGVASARARVISGLRTYEEQQQIYDQGRARPGAIVTNARPGESFHNFGLAFDIGMYPLPNGAYIQDGPQYDQAAEMIEKHLPGLSWGGQWKTPDRSHFQMAGLPPIAEVRERFENGSLFELLRSIISPELRERIAETGLEEWR